jgi:hypothetical protein
LDRKVVLTAHIRALFWNTDTPAAPVTTDSVTFGDSGQIGKSGTLQYQSITGPVSIPAAAAPFDPSSGLPYSKYPDRIYRKFRLATYEPLHRVFGVITQTPVMSWESYTALYPSRLHRVNRVQPVSLVRVLDPSTFVEPQPFDPSLFPRGSFPVAVASKKIHASRIPYWWMDRFDAPAAPAFDIRHFPRGYYPDTLNRKFRSATYEPDHRVFSVITQTPVMSWEGYTNLYPSRTYRKVRVQPLLPVGSLDPSTFVAPAFDPATLPRVFYPDRISFKPRQHPAAFVSVLDGTTFNSPLDPVYLSKVNYPNRFPARVLRPLGTTVAPVNPVPPFVTEWQFIGPDYIVRAEPRILPSGAIAPLIRNYILTCDTGIYLINGQDANLLWSGLVGGGSNTRITFRLIVQDDDYNEDSFL